MSGSLRQAARGLTRVFERASQMQQRRFAGDLPVKPNKHIEEWATRREHLENEFKWDRKSLTSIAIFTLVVPYFVYSVSVSEYDKTDVKFGRSKREFWGSNEA